MQPQTQQDTWKQLVGEAAAQLVEEAMVIGLGSGSTAAYFTHALADRISHGLSIVGAVPTSNETGQLARSLGIPLTDLDTHPVLDLDVDGADEVDGQLNLIKGGGGALLREKIVASNSQRFIVIVDVTKQVTRLGLGIPVPVEVIPFASTPVRMKLQELGATVQLRRHGDQVFLTDNGNVILDCYFVDGITDPEGLQLATRSIVGVVETGLFLNMTEQVIVGGPDGVRSIGRPG